MAELTAEERADYEKTLGYIKGIPSKIYSLYEKSSIIKNKLDTAIQNIDSGVVLFYTPFGLDELSAYYNEIKTLESNLLTFKKEVSGLVSYYESLLN